MPEYMLAPALHDGAAPSHSDEVDTMAAQWSMFTKLLMTWYMDRAKKSFEEHIRLKQRLREQAHEDRIADEQRLAAERSVIETRITKLLEDGLDNASRGEIAELLADSVIWREDSKLAELAVGQLTGHIRGRYGLEIDPETGEVRFDGPVEPLLPGQAPRPSLAAALAEAEIGRVGQARLRKAQDRMVELVAAEAGLDESDKAELYAAIAQWRANPTARGLDELGKKLADKKLDEPVRTRIRFVAAYLGTPNELVNIEDLGAIDSVSASRELRRMGEPVVDPGEEAKARTDKLLVSYQDAVRLGGPTESVRKQLAETIAVMTPQDQARARERGAEIRDNPSEKREPLWPGYIDRDELASKVRMYAVLAPKAEHAAGKAADLDDADALALHRQAAAHKKAINFAIKEGKGLHEWEKDQLALVMRDVEAGKQTAPEMVFADDRTAAAVDTDRIAHRAQVTTATTRHQVEKTLDTNAAPAGTVRRTRDSVSRVLDAQNQVAAGRASLSDYEDLGLDRQLDARLSAAGVPEHVRKQVAAQLVDASREAATVGKAADRIAEQWDNRREAVVAARTPAPPAYDSPERREGLAENLRATAGLDDDQLAQRMAADAGHAKPASAAPKSARRNGRRTSPGAGMNLGHRRRGRGPDKGLGL